MKMLIWIILFVIGIVLIKIFFEKIKFKKSVLGYLKKERVMNTSEQALYINLQKTLGDKFIILSKVRIEDFVEVKSDLARNKFNGLRNRIKSRHVDFLICDLATTKPLLAIELDGASHKNIDRIERDKFVNNLYGEINLKVEHVLKGSDFLEEATKIKNILKNKN